MVVLKYLVKMLRLVNAEITTRRANGVLCGYVGIRLSNYAAPVQTDQFKFEQLVVASRQQEGISARFVGPGSEFSRVAA